MTICVSTKHDLLVRSTTHHPKPSTIEFKERVTRTHECRMVNVAAAELYSSTTFTSFTKRQKLIYQIRAMSLPGTLRIFPVAKEEPAGDVEWARNVYF